MTVAKSVLDAIGNTPLIRLRRASEATGCEILGKAEFMNPGQSVKDRAALYIIRDAEKRGLLRPGGRIVEGTAGNTGIGLAMVAAASGYRTTIVIPRTQSQEKKDALRVLGAELVEVPAVPYKNPNNYVKLSGRLAEQLAKTEPNGAIWANQFDNVANREAHIETTAPEIWRDTDGKVDIFISSVGTGGTITGTAQGLKGHKPDVQIVAVEPKDSAVLHGGRPGPHAIQGIGAGFIPKVLDISLVDDVIDVSNEDAYGRAREVAKTDGLLVGISSGASLQAALELASRPENEGKTIVVLLPDGGERYLSTALFEG